MSQLALFPQGTTATETSLALPAALSFEEWQEVGQRLQDIERSIMWWIGDWLQYGEQRYGDKYKGAIEVTGKAYDTLSKAKSVAARFEFRRRRRNLPWSHHREVAALPEKEQDAALNWAEDNQASKRDLRKYCRSLKARIKHGEPGEAGPLPAGQYRVIYADPPWSYKSDPAEIVAAEDHYGTEPVQSIASMPVRDLRASDSVLFLWATSPCLPEAIEVIQSWGFEYKSMFIWDKVKHNMGHYNSVRHELLLIATHGSCTPENRVLYDSVISIPRTEHSRKPEKFREIIDVIYPYGNRIELFSRTDAENWVVWGDRSARAV